MIRIGRSVAVVGATVVISGGLLGLLKWKSWI